MAGRVAGFRPSAHGVPLGLALAAVFDPDLSLRRRQAERAAHLVGAPEAQALAAVVAEIRRDIATRLRDGRLQVFAQAVPSGAWVFLSPARVAQLRPIGANGDRWQAGIAQFRSPYVHEAAGLPVGLAGRLFGDPARVLRLAELERNGESEDERAAIVAALKDSIRTEVRAGRMIRDDRHLVRRPRPDIPLLA